MRASFNTPQPVVDVGQDDPDVSRTGAGLDANLLSKRSIAFGTPVGDQLDRAPWQAAQAERPVVIGLIEPMAAHVRALIELNPTWIEALAAAKGLGFREIVGSRGPQFGAPLATDARGLCFLALINVRSMELNRIDIVVPSRAETKSLRA